MLLRKLNVDYSHSVSVPLQNWVCFSQVKTVSLFVSTLLHLLHSYVSLLPVKRFHPFPLLRFHSQRQYVLPQFSCPPAPSCPFQLCHCTSLHSAGRRLPQWPLRGPIPSTALMQCSCFQIQPLILILFLLFNSAVPVDSSDLVVHCGRLMI